MDQARFDTRNLFCHLFLPLKIYCLVPQRAENQRMLFKFGGPLGEPTEPLVNQRPKILFKILVKTNEPLAFPYTATQVGAEGSFRNFALSRLFSLILICPLGREMVARGKVLGGKGGKVWQGLARFRSK
jgi:hypothetical protein